MRNAFYIFALMMLVCFVFLLCCTPYEKDEANLVLWMLAGAFAGIMAAAGTEGFIRRRNRR